MRRLPYLLALLVLAQFPHPGWANTLPGKVDYIVYARGKEVGRCNITVKETADSLVLDSKTHIDFTGDIALDITSHTVADPKTYLVRSYTVYGSKGDSRMDASFTVVGDSIHGRVLRGDNERVDYVKSPFERTLFLEDYVMEHEMLIALAHEATGEPALDYGIFFPTSMVLNPARVGFASRVTIDSDTKSAVCEKLLVALKSGTTWASYYDPKRRLPVYMAFPGMNVEVFLDEFFDGHPITRFRE